MSDPASAHAACGCGVASEDNITTSGSFEELIVTVLGVRPDAEARNSALTESRHSNYSGGAKRAEDWSLQACQWVQSFSSADIERAYTAAFERGLLQRVRTQFTFLAVQSLLFAPAAFLAGAPTAFVAALAAFSVVSVAELVGLFNFEIFQQPRSVHFILEITGGLLLALIVLSSPTLLDATCMTMIAFGASALVIRPPPRVAIVQTGTVFAGWVINVAAHVVAAQQPLSAIAEVLLPRGVLVLVALVQGLVSGRVIEAGERADFSSQREQRALLRLTRAVLGVHLPPLVVPRLLAQGAEGSWAGAADTAEPDVSVVFVRINHFASVTTRCTPPELLALLQRTWRTCASIADRHGVRMIEVSDNVFVGAAGLSGEGAQCSNHAAAAVAFGLEVAARFQRQGGATGGDNVAVTVGIDTGAAVAGFLGSIRPQYVLVGDVVNTASRMAVAACSLGVSLLMTAATRAWVSPHLACTGLVAEIKGKGTMHVFAPSADDDAATVDSLLGCSLVAPPATAAVVAAEVADAAVAAAASKAWWSWSRLAYADPQLEARWHARRLPARAAISWQSAACVAAALAVSAAGVFRPFPWLLLIAGPLAVLGTQLFTSVHVGVAFALPWLAGFPHVTAAFSLGDAVLGMILFFTVPVLDGRTRERIAVALLGAALVTAQHCFAAAGTLLALPPAAGEAPLLSLAWMWAMASLAAGGLAQLEASQRAGFASADAARAAHATAAAVLDRLMPRPLSALVATGRSPAELTAVHVDVALLVMDVVGFTALSAELQDAPAVFALLNEAFAAFERIVEREGAYKVKTVGDSLVVVAGLSGPLGGGGNNDNDDGASFGSGCVDDAAAHSPSARQGTRARHAAALLRVAADMHATAVRLLRHPRSGEPLRMRMGLHVGSVIGGVVSTRGHIYDIWGPDMVAVSAAESACPAGAVLATKPATEALRHAAVPGLTLTPGTPRAGAAAAGTATSAPASGSESAREDPLAGSHVALLAGTVIG